MPSNTAPVSNSDKTDPVSVILIGSSWCSGTRHHIGMKIFMRNYICLVLTLVVALFVVHFFQKRADKEILTNSRAVSRAATLKRDGGIKVIDGSFDHRQTFGIQESV